MSASNLQRIGTALCWRRSEYWSPCRPRPDLGPIAFPATLVVNFEKALTAAVAPLSVLTWRRRAAQREALGRLRHKRRSKPFFQRKQSC